MGQRLVVELVDKEHIIGVVYYHWSGYFVSATDELADLCRDILKAESENKDILLSVLERLERRGGGVGVNDKNLAEAKKRFPGRDFKKDISRNCGLLYLGESEIQDTINMAEANAYIYIDEHLVYNGAQLTDFYDVGFGTGCTVINGQSIDVDSTDEMTMDDCIRLSDFIKTVAMKGVKRQ